MSLLGGVIVSGPFLLSFMLLPPVAFGVFWAPVGAILCGASAYFRGLNPIRYALAGLVFSALLFFPWLYLILRIHGVPVPRFAVRLMYLVLYFFWFFGVFHLGALLAVSTGATVFRGDFPADTPPEVLAQLPSPFMAYVAIVVAALSGITWLISLIWLVRSDRRRREQGGASDTPLPAFVYIAPFGLTILWLVATRVLHQVDKVEAITSIFTSLFTLL